MDKWEKAHRANISRYQKKLKAIYESVTKEAAALGVRIPNINPNKPFSFADYPQTKKKAEQLFAELDRDTYNVALNGIKVEWMLANNKNSALADIVFGSKKNELTKEQIKRYYSNNEEARQMFIERKVEGLNLSDRVWKYTNQYKTEIEAGLEVAIRDGIGAEDMAIELKKYINNPDKLFRRVRDIGSKNVKVFHPGKGVYPSSFKNARRLVATETNIAYRTSDYVRYQQLDFVVGIEIHLSNNHPVHDICNDLAGKYPKDFKFTGWHPQCRCFTTSILKTREEFDADNAKIMRGELLSGDSVNKVEDVPKGFKDWQIVNNERLKTAKSLPYFIRDNEKYVTQINITRAAEKGVREAQDFNNKILGKIKEIEELEPATIDSALEFINKYFYDDYKTEIKEFDTCVTTKGSSGDTAVDKDIHLTDKKMKDFLYCLEKVKRGQFADITDIEANAMHTFLHEYTHNRAKYGQYILSFGVKNTQTGEMLNELMTRHDLRGYYSSLGAKDLSSEVWKTLEKARSGYDIYIRNFNYIIKQTGLDYGKVMADILGQYFTESLSNSPELLAKILLKNGLKNLSGKDATLPNALKLVETMITAQDGETIQNVLVRMKYKVKGSKWAYKQEW